MTLARILLFGAVLLAAGLTELPAQTRRPARRPIPNLNGPWESDEEGIVTVVQSGSTIRVLTNRACGSTQRSFYLQGTLSSPDQAGVMTITNGTMLRCENQDPIIQTCCGPRDTWQTTFKAQVVGDYSITGQRVGEEWDAESKNGSIDPATCKKLKDFEDDFILLRQSPTATPSATASPPASSGPGSSPSPTPEYDFFEDVRDTVRQGWEDTVEWAEDIPDEIGWTDSWDWFLNEDPGGKRIRDAYDEAHREDGVDDE